MRHAIALAALFMCGYQVSAHAQQQPDAPDPAATALTEREAKDLEAQITEVLKSIAFEKTEKKVEYKYHNDGVGRYGEVRKKLSDTTVSFLACGTEVPIEVKEVDLEDADSCGAAIPKADGTMLVWWRNVNTQSWDVYAAADYPKAVDIAAILDKTPDGPLPPIAKTVSFCDPVAVALATAAEKGGVGDYWGTGGVLPLEPFEIVGDSQRSIKFAPLDFKNCALPGSSVTPLLTWKHGDLVSGAGRGPNLKNEDLERLGEVWSVKAFDPDNP
jgi:hypothetical protein